MKKLFVVLCVAAVLSLVGCTTTDQHQPMPRPVFSAPDDDDSDVDPSEISMAPAVGVIANPVTLRIFRWLGQAALQLIANTRIDLKIDGTLADKKGE